MDLVRTVFFSIFRTAEKTSEQSRSDNRKVALAALVYMICGATICFLVIG